MNILDIIIVLFIIIESLNIIILYFFTDSKLGNSVGVFDDYHKLKNGKHSHFIEYLTNWIANCKLIFVSLLIIILFHGNDIVKSYSLIAMLISISMYYFSLHPIIKELDKNNKLTINNYSKKLFLTITAILLAFLITLIYVN